ncbi:MAG: bifunctional metallophosphatase/5'-nucleotidase [Prevotella sp.]|nr:bifunctional metallophosphatase/5'-nucleotidase [Prevotella sp.]
MKRRLIMLSWIAIFVVASLTAQRRELHIVAVNDMHAQIQNFPQLAAIVDSLRTLYPSLLVFSAGDNRTGNPMSDKYEVPGYPMVALMNLVGFDASALGNHEFDVKSLPALIGMSNFRYLCCNIFPDSTSGVRVRPCQVFDADGIRVGVIGTIQLSPQGIPSTHPDNLEGLSFKPAREVVGEYEWLRGQCDVVILLSHQGYEEDRAMAREFPWIDVILGGHTHKQLTGGEQTNGILITQNKNKLPFAAHVTLTLDGDSIVSKESEYINVKAFESKNPVVELMVQQFSDNSAFRRVLAQAVTPFSMREELGCMVCDAYMAVCHADIAVENAGGVRIDTHPEGDFTVLDVLEMSPFDNHAVVLNLTGHELLHMLLTYCHGRLWSFPFVGGMRCRVTADPENPRKIRDAQLLTLDGEPLDMDRTYRVATNSYVPATSEVPEGSAQTLNIMTTDIIMQYLGQKQTVDYHGVRRLELVQ